MARLEARARIGGPSFLIENGSSRTPNDCWPFGGALPSSWHRSARFETRGPLLSPKPASSDGGADTGEGSSPARTESEPIEEIR